MLIFGQKFNNKEGYYEDYEENTYPLNAFIIFLVQFFIF